MGGAGYGRFARGLVWVEVGEADSGSGSGIVGGMVRVRGKRALLAAWIHVVGGGGNVCAALGAGSVGAEDRWMAC